MASDLDIINDALDRLGVAPITAIGEDSEAGGLANRTYGQHRDAYLQSHPWGFATKRVMLTELSPAPDSSTGFSRRLQLPSDYLRVVEVIDAITDDWVVENGELLTSITDDIWVRYIRQVIQPGLFSAAFANGLAGYLAVKWAERLTRSSSTAERLRQDERRDTQDARSFDGQESQVKVIQVEGWTSER